MILVAGEALVDLVPDGDGDRAFAAHPGGGPFNTARTVARLGEPVAFLGRVSSDGLGRTLADLLEADGVNLGPLIRTDDPTTLAIAEVGPGGVAGYRFYERGTSAPGITPGEAVERIPEGVTMLHVGTLGLVLEPLASATEALVGELAGRALVWVDPNHRPEAIADPAAHRRRLDRILAQADLVKVSEEDLGFLEPGHAPLDAARALLALGPAVVLLTRGGEGATVVTAGSEIAVAAPQVEMVDTIGAGDAFGGGWVAWWHRRGLGRDALADPEALEAATRHACLVAARTCARAGASPPMRDEL